MTHLEKTEQLIEQLENSLKELQQESIEYIDLIGATQDNDRQDIHTS